MRRLATTSALCLVLLTACGENNAHHARQVLRTVHVPEVKRWMQADLLKHNQGIARAGERIAPGFTADLPDEQTRERQMRRALLLLHTPPRGIQQLLASPMTFLAAVKPNGVVMCRDTDPDLMKGMNLAQAFPSVQEALTQRHVAHSIGEFPPLTPEQHPSVSIVFAAPAIGRDGNVVGAAALGIPLWRLEQRVSRQLQLDHVAETGVVLWSYVYRGDDIYSQQAAHPDLDTIVPNGAERRAGLARSPGGFTTEREQYGRWYGFAILPMPSLGENMGFILVRSDPI